jgi:hypothetical protein
LKEDDFEIFLEDFCDMLTAFEASIAKMKQQIAKLVGVETKQSAAVREETFTCLKFEAQQGAKIGEFEVAYKEHNLPENWNSAYNVLKQSNATINNRYHGENYEHSYWLYGEGKIYRQKLKHKQA